MDVKLLTPSSSGHNLSQSKPLHTSSDILDGFKYDWAPKNPAGEPTKPKKISNPPPVKLQEPRLDLTARSTYEDPDHVFVQTAPHIFQRKQGGWNAKLPEVELNDVQTVIPPAQLSLRENEQQKKSPNVKQRGEDSKYMALRLIWTTQRDSKKRKLGFTITDTNNPAYDVEIQSSGAQSSATQNGDSPNGADQSDKVKNGIASGNDIHDRKALVAKSLSGHEGPLELDMPRRVLWQHSLFKSMSVDKFLHAVSDCKAQGLSESEYGLTKRLMTRLRILSERPFVGGRYLNPLALRYDNQDISKYTVEKTCIFFSFPYLCLDAVDLRQYYEKDSVEHPPRTLLQSHYRLNKTEDRDELQCVKWLKAHRLTSCISESDKEKASSHQVKALFYVPQFWGLIVGLDTLITSSCCDERTLCGPDVQLKRLRLDSGPKKLSLVRILFYRNEELEELIYPIHQCESCFGLLNKSQQILELLAEETAPQRKAETGDPQKQSQRIKSDEYHFWREDDGLPVTFENWASILQECQGQEMLSIRLQIETPAISLSTPNDGNPVIKAVKTPGLQVTSQTSAREPKTPSFLEWPMRDEFGEKETLDVNTRLSMFLRAIYLGLPLPHDMTKKERAKYPQAVSEKRAQAKANLTFQPTSFAKLKSNIGSSSLDGIGQELLDKAKNLMLLFVPPSHGLEIEPKASGLFWGAVSEILQEVGKEESFKTQVRAFMDKLDLVTTSATHLHRGVHCLRSKNVPGVSEWRDEDAMADGTILLSAVVDAFGSIFHMFVEAVRYVKSDNDIKKTSPLMSEKFAVSRHAEESVRLLEHARDQLIREADGRDENDTIGPVLTPEAITITIIERLVSGVYQSGTLDIVGLYEACLEHLTLKVKYEASRRLLQKINEFSEEVAIVNDVLKQQNNVLLQFRSSLDPESFTAPSLARKLRFKYECKGIDKILVTINEHLRAYAELRDRAKQLSIENVQLVETLQDDNSKAIFIFTMVTILFLPLSFVAGFFGMNVVGITDTTEGVRHFWEIAVPLTVGIVVLCIVVAVKGEDTYFVSTRIWRYGRGMFTSRL